MEDRERSAEEAAGEAAIEEVGAFEATSEVAGAEATAPEAEAPAAEEPAAKESGAEAVEAEASEAGASEAAALPGVPGAATGAPASVPVSAVATAPSSPKSTQKAVVVIAAIAALLVGLLIGAFAINTGGGSGAGDLVGKSVVPESGLDSVVATYTADGKTESVTVREVIEQTTSLSASRDESGNYQIPSADSALSVVRNKVLLADAGAKGITVSDDEVKAYAEEQLGTSDFASIATSYGMEESAVLEYIRQSCLMNALQKSVLGDQHEAGEMPEPPAEPEASQSASPEADSAENAEGGNAAAADGAQQVGGPAGASSAASTSSASPLTKEYADYVIKLAGDEWDASKGTWASTDGPYYQALSSYEITPEGASYEAAMAAYYVAYQAYSDSASAANTAWNDYVKSLMNKVTITIYTLLA